MRGNGDLAGKKQGGYPSRYLRHVEYNMSPPSEDGGMDVYIAMSASRLSLTVLSRTGFQGPGSARAWWFEKVRWLTYGGISTRAARTIVAGTALNI